MKWVLLACKRILVMETVLNIETTPTIHKLTHNHIIYRAKWRRDPNKKPKDRQAQVTNASPHFTYWIKIAKTNL